ncbi:hypothetical protein PUN28_004795 [Cardiocondyla obscurior]|uniref:Uncharacterized protein n=1 Tax=Cardiocondyla obscurior TaxID=286306 RepID=A0AAW2GEH8_9HYME
MKYFRSNNITAAKVLPRLIRDKHIYTLLCLDPYGNELYAKETREIRCFPSYRFIFPSLLVVSHSCPRQLLPVKEVARWIRRYGGDNNFRGWLFFRLAVVSRINLKDSRWGIRGNLDLGLTLIFYFFILSKCLYDFLKIGRNIFAEIELKLVSLEVHAEYVFASIIKCKFSLGNGIILCISISI